MNEKHLTSILSQRYLVSALACLALGMLIMSCQSAGRRSFILARTPQDSIVPTAIDLAAYEEKYPDYDGVYLLREYVVEQAQRPYAGSNYSWDIYKIGTARYVVLDPSEEQLTTFRLNVEWREKLVNAYMTVISPDGTVRTFDEDDLKEERNSNGETVYRFAYPGIVRGSIIDEGYEIHHDYLSKRRRHHEIPLQFSLPCERLSVRYAYPDDWVVDVKKIAPDRSVAYTTTSEDVNNLMVISYDAVDVPPIHDEPNSPYVKEFADYLEIAIEKYYIGGAAYDVVPESWSVYAERYRDYALDRGSTDTWKIREQVEEIVDESDPPLEKMRKIVTWVQQEVEVDGQVSRPEYEFHDMIGDKIGNPDFVCGLTRAMLLNVGISSTLVVMHSAEDGYFDSTYSYVGSIVSPALAVELDGIEYYLFPYIKNYPIDQIPNYFQGEPALRVTEDGYGGFDTIPHTDIAQSRIESRYDVELDDDGVLHVKEIREFRGDAAYVLRRSFEKLKDKELEAEIEEMLTYEDGEVSLKDYRIEGQEDYYSPLIVRMEYDVDNLVTVTSEEVLVQSAGLFSPSSSTSTKVDTEKRSNPIRIFTDESLVKQVSITYPKDWKLTTELDPVREENKFGQITATYEISEGLLKVNHERILKRNEAPASEYDQLLKLSGKKSRLYVPTLIFSKEG